MQKFSSLRPFIAALLVALLLAVPLSHAAAEQRQQYQPLSPYTPPEEQEEGPSTAAKLFGAAAFVGLLWCAWTGCISGNPNGGAQGSPSTQDTQRWWREEERKQKPEAVRPDTSIGCAWGDRASGTCVR